jgi:hypothetical protein
MTNRNPVLQPRLAGRICGGMAAGSDLDWMQKPARREARVDMLRGIALLCIYVDHVPSNVLNAVTLRNYGFSDAAELFVMLAGFASLMAYGRSFARDGAMTGLRRIFMRCARIYVFQVGLLLATIGIVSVWETHYGLEPHSMAPLLHGGVHEIVRGLTLRSQPSNLNILPLYILLLSVFPLIYAGIRVSLGLTLAVSAALWLATNIYPQLNLINTFDGNGWFFDPLSWQFIFVIGAAMAVIMARRGGELPRWPWLVALCWLFLAASLLEVFPWTDWGLPNLAPLSMEPPDKTHLAPLRLLHAMALVYVALSWRGWTGSARSVAIRAVEVCGKHSLEVFSLGTLLALVARLAFRTFDDTWQMQVVVNVVGLGAMIGLGWLLERARKRSASPAGQPSGAVPAIRRGT